MAKLTKKDALRAYAAMLNTADISKLESLLSDDFRYVSQLSFKDLESKQDFLQYIAPKVKGHGGIVWAEMGHVEPISLHGPCVVVTENGLRIGLVFVEVEKGKIKALHWCIVPHPESAVGTGEYPE
jgi:hypothetical protein